MDDKKYTLTFYVDNQKEEHPESHWEPQFISVRNESKPPILPIGYNRKERLKKRSIPRSQQPTRRAPSQWRLARRPESKLVMVACSAIAIGIIMGLMVLSFFAEENHPRTAMQTESVSSLDTGGEDMLLIQAGYVADDLLYLPSRTYYVLQAGAFSDQQAAQQAADKYKAGGFPAAVFSAPDAHRVYLAVGRRADGLKELGPFFEKEEVDLYVRSYEIPELELNIGQEKEQLEPVPTFLASGNQLLNQLLELSTRLLIGKGNITEEERKGMEQLHRQLLLDGQRVLAQASTPMAELVEQLMHTLTTGVSALEAYAKQPHESFAWQIQQAGLNYLFQYEQLLAWLEKAL